ncbi:hypothetical protein [Psittacicella hinzii]|uniref:Uncharacterized protein n=1 Tax=Psittacicella hinzii TaxID=2028575 RepID=A0A3A1YTF6_9GAMM|nr:hypothetical protein [Psittacicella hinzii]RIY39684.1 hypothetical protein CKF58_01685 [Psittacicella hinzii]
MTSSIAQAAYNSRANVEYRLQHAYQAHKTLLTNTHNALTKFEQVLVYQTTLSMQHYFFSLSSMLNNELHPIIARNRYSNTAADAVYTFAQTCNSLPAGRSARNSRNFPQWDKFCAPFKTISASFTSLNQFKSLLVYTQFLSYSSLQKQNRLGNGELSTLRFYQSVMTRVHKNQSTVNDLGFTYSALPAANTTSGIRLIRQINRYLASRNLPTTVIKDPRT